MPDQVSLVEFYTHVYPVELVVRWLTYDFSEVKEEEGRSRARGDGEEGRPSRQGVFDRLARREFCFTLIGDIFTRFRSYSNAAELRNELIRSFPEKIDVGAVYNIRPSQKQSVTNVFPVERELVFDIDMSDYDNVRSCCSGKSICQHCWTWMSCAAEVLRYLLENDFGFNYILPVFSGRRGVHLWVCDRRARGLSDDERAALVGYLTVVAPKTLRSNVVQDLANHRPIHPSLRRIAPIVDDHFKTLFLSSSIEGNPNNVEENPNAAKVIYEAVCSVLKLGRRDALNSFLSKIKYGEGDVLDGRNLYAAIGEGNEGREVMFAAQLLVLYPRLDEHVTTRRDHLLKLPFCIHPGTSSLCCPLEWASLRSFDPINGAPRLDSILMERRVEEKFFAPLRRLLEAMSGDPREAA